MDTAHALVTEEMTRESLYVASTRARPRPPGTPRPRSSSTSAPTASPTHRSAALEVLTGVLQRTGAEQSATTTIRETQREATSLPTLVGALPARLGPGCARRPPRLGAGRAPTEPSPPRAQPSPDSSTSPPLSPVPAPTRPIPSRSSAAPPPWASAARPARCRWCSRPGSRRPDHPQRAAGGAGRPTAALAPASTGRPSAVG